MTRRWLLWPLLGLVTCSSTTGTSNAPPTTAVVVCPEGKAPGPGGTCAEAAPATSVASSNVAPSHSAPLFRPLPTPETGDLSLFVGVWSGEDSDSSARYDLQITSDGRYTQTITTLNSASGRSPGSCFQQGTVRFEENRLVWFYEQNSCNTDYEGREDPDEVTEQGRRHFVLSMSSYQIHYNRVR